MGLRGMYTWGPGVNLGYGPHAMVSPPRIHFAAGQLRSGRGGFQCGARQRRDRVFPSLEGYGGLIDGLLEQDWNSWR